MKMHAIEGNTYPVRDKLREMGAKWSSKDKAWFITEDKLAEANALVAAVPAKKKKPFHCKCPVCGTEFDANQ